MKWLVGNLLGVGVQTLGPALLRTGLALLAGAAAALGLELPPGCFAS